MRAALRLLGNLLRIGLLPVWLLSHRLRRPRGRWVELRLSPHPVEVAGPGPLWQRLLRRGERSGLRSIVELRRLTTLIAADARTEGLLLYVPHLSAGWATCTSVRDALLSLRKRGKRVVVYLPLGGGNRELYVALAADRVLTAPQAPVTLLGVASQSVYVKSLLDRIGVQAEVHAHGEFKTAAEPLVREAMSEPQREQLAALIDGIQRELELAVAARPGLGAERAHALFEQGVWGAKAALQAGLIDGCCYEDELATELGAGAGAESRPVAAAGYLAWRRARLWRRVRPLPGIAVVPVHGAISHAGPTLPGSRVATLSSVVSALRRARKSRAVRGVLLHVDSPGGSALASDLIHRELLRLREKKPVVAYFGDVAASGGYYVGAPCQYIVAQPTTMTGSIGVVSVRLLAGALAERLGLRAQTLRGAPHADMGSPFRALDAAENAMLAAELDAIYQSFVGVVAQGRQRLPEDIEGLARGRVWSGADALRCGLVDALGGFDRALLALRELVPELRGLPEEQVSLLLSSAVPAQQPPPAPTPAVPSGALSWASLLEWCPSEIREALPLFGGTESAVYYAFIPRFW